MNSIVNQLSEIENAAAAILEHAEAQKAVLEEDMKKKQAMFDAALEADTKQRLKEISEKLESQKTEELKKLKEENERILAAFNREYETKHEDYARKILKHIIEV